jgi:glutamate--cysteine ligase
MPSAPAPYPAVPLDRDQLLHTFTTYGNPRSRWRVGGEFERALVRPDGRPVGYAEPDGIRWVLDTLHQVQPGWTPEAEAGSDLPIALLRPDGSSITLEPGGQVELSGAPHLTCAELGAELDENRQALLQMAEGRPLRWIAAGFTPFASVDDIEWMPKGRYRVMREYLPTRGDLGTWMMKGTCSVQCNYDFADEQDAAEKVRLTAGVASLTTAMFANSPLVGGEPSGFLSFRGHIWTRTDPDRTGFPPGLREDFSFERWVDYLLDVPMMFYKIDGRWIPAHGRSFRSWMAEGVDGRFPTLKDWDLHQTSVFPEVRIKRTIEVRGADAVSAELAVAFCALFEGLLYDDRARDEALQLVAELGRHGDRDSRFAEACRAGLEGEIGGRRISAWAEELCALGAAGLARWRPVDRPLLDPLLAQVETGRSPGARLLDLCQGNASPAALLDAMAY